MIPLEEARRFVMDACRPLPVEDLGLDRALGLVLAAPVRAPHPVPPFANSAMDGYAVRAEDTADAPRPLRVIGTVLAGQHSDLTVGPGEAMRIMTGAPVPAGADAICILEETRELEGGLVEVERAVPPKNHVRFPGDDVAAGAEVFEAGTALTAAHVGVLASLGIGTVAVHRRPRVGVASTGDELVEPGRPLGPGQIHDSNRPALRSQLASDGFEAVDLGNIGDDEASLETAFREADGACDAIVTSGGVSVGDRDLVKVVLERLAAGSMRWMQIAIRPAKPFAFGVLAGGQTPVFGLPGNPVSALVSYELFVRPALRAMAGERQVDRPRFSAVADSDLRRTPDGKLHLLRVQATLGRDGFVHVRPSAGQGSHMLRAMADANALALVPDGDGISAGDRVEVVLLDAQRLG